MSRKPSLNPKFTPEEKVLRDAFHRWMGNPTNTYVLQMLSERMVAYEIKVRMGRITITNKPDAPLPVQASEDDLHNVQQ